MVALIVRHQLADGKDKQVDAQRRITDLGIDDLSLRKGHKLYVTTLSDLQGNGDIQRVRHEVVTVAVSRCLATTTPAVLPAVSYRDRRHG
jgi:hypothetical protein